MSDTPAPDPDFVGIQDFKVVASYGYPNEQQDARCFPIMVPGMPRVWQPPRVPPALRGSTGYCTYGDQAAPNQSPLDPALCAVLTMQPQHDFKDLDIITDRSQRKGLMGMSTGESLSWTWDVEIVGNTVLIMRAEHKPKKLIDHFIGCRPDFEAKYFRYKRRAESLTDTSSPRGERSVLLQIGNFETVGVNADGKMMPIDRVLEYYLKRGNDTVFYTDKKPELWLSQTANFVWANPSSVLRGESLPWEEFQDVVEGRAITKYEDVLSDVTDWQEKNQGIIRGLVASIKSLIECVRAGQETMGGARFVLHHDRAVDGFVCEVAAEGQAPGLPEEVRDRMINGGDSLPAAIAPQAGDSTPSTDPVWSQSGAAALKKRLLKSKSAS
ncbi:hypothetical protein LTR78_006021 [Recurvomyces mirabilis]|uniref:Uncharacterized protein n=1 Tax=Recurvomyces mirabilis TaxID=574656 RepID=A0AAE0WLY6_9PEZI|nr:hypothetical protein LTR78_006021 [Recurvomyces mirabilis]